jgi:hypothetical protein
MKCIKCGVDKVEVIKSVDNLIADIATMREVILNLQQEVKKQSLMDLNNLNVYYKKDTGI